MLVAISLVEMANTMSGSLWAGQQELAIPDWEAQLEWSGFMLILWKYGSERQRAFACGLAPASDREVDDWRSNFRRAVEATNRYLQSAKPIPRYLPQVTPSERRDDMVRAKFRAACGKSEIYQDA